MYVSRGAVCAALICVLLAIPAASQNLEIHHIDVGQGDATLIIGPDGSAILIDGGNNGLGVSEILPYLKSHGVRALALMIATHMDADHVGGLDEILESDIAVDAVLHNGSAINSGTAMDFMNAAGKHAIVVGEMEPGRTFDLGHGATITCIIVNGDTGSDYMNVFKENDKSIGLLISYDNFQYFIAGDLGGGGTGHKNVEKMIHPLVDDLDVLRINHHGSNSSTDSTFLQYTSPETAIISVGNNSYGHPTSQVMDRLYRNNVDVWRTGGGSFRGGRVSGDIVVKVKPGKKYFINGEKKLKDEFVRNNNKAPSARFSYKASALKVTFDGSNSSDDKRIKRFFWDFGDGSFQSGRKLTEYTHTYQKAGTYPVTLVCTDRFGITDTYYSLVTVKDSDEERPTRQLVVTAFASPATPPQYSHVKINVTVKDQNGSPVSGASIRTVAHYKTTDTVKTGVTGSSGTASIDYYISRATVGYRVWVDVTVTRNGLTGSARTSFVPR